MTGGGAGRGWSHRGYTMVIRRDDDGDRYWDEVYAEKAPNVSIWLPSLYHLEKRGMLTFADYVLALDESLNSLWA